jgi:hypothetical protein
MNDPRVAALAALTFGTAMEGGHFAGYFAMPDGAYGLVVAPKATGQIKGAWSPKRKDVAGARSYFDCRANTLAMAEAGSVLAQQIASLSIGGFSDWAIPSRDVLELCYRNLKPTTRENYVWRNGDNPSSLPPGYPYTEELPTQTDVAAFQEGGAEAFDEDWYWSSTQYSADIAWSQLFYDGYQGSDDKSYEGLARAVRRFKA